mgnify:CR=1 FL=1|jgi:hypothetical protein
MNIKERIEYLLYKYHNQRQFQTFEINSDLDDFFVNAIASA